MKSLKIVTLAGMAAGMFVSQAMAGDYPVSTQQQRINRVYEYWQG